MVVKVGTGAATRSSAAHAVTLERRYLDTVGALVPGGAVAMPIAANGNNKPLTLSGTASSEGLLSLSQNGLYVTLAGYGVVPGTSSVKGRTTSAANRVVGRVSGNGTVDTTTAFTTDASLSGDNVRSATTVDGTRFWVAGAGTTTTGGVWVIDFSAATGTQIFQTPKSPRALSVVSDQLYGTGAISPSGSPNPMVYTVGSGTPTMAATPTILPGMLTTGAESFFSFVFFDRDGTVPGLDTLYVADENDPTGTGGIQKWKFNGTTWSLATTFTNGLNGTTLGVRGLAGKVVAGTVMLVATTAADDAATHVSNNVVLYQDDDINPVVQVVLATSPTDTIYRGVALAP
jgi:hypothetical protein